MHSKSYILFAGVACILAMLAYLFVFADAPLVELEKPPAGAAQQ
ncbi:MAG: hypothetical protein ACT4N2_00285 [Hyphomicrobium sp.]